MAECNVCGEEHPGMKHWVANWAAYWHLTANKPERSPRRVRRTAQQLLPGFEESAPYTRELETMLPEAA